MSDPPISDTDLKNKMVWVGVQIGPEKSIFERTILRKGQRARKAKKIKRTKIRINQNRRNSSLKRNLRKIIFVQVEKF